MKWMLVAACTLAVVALIALLAFIFVPELSVALVSEHCSDGCEDESAIEIARSIGRLDVIALSLGVLGIGVGFFVVLSIFAITDHAKQVSEKYCEEFKANLKRELETQIETQIMAKVQAVASELRVPDPGEVNTSGATPETED